VVKLKIVGDLIENISIKPMAKVKSMSLLFAWKIFWCVLYSLPANVDALNITMGYSSKNNQAQILIAKLFKTHTNA
jgi:hypothetical protein